MTEPPPPLLPLTVEASPEVETGTYANTVSTWYTETDLAVDFAVVLPSEAVETDQGPAVLPRARLVSRVRMPPAQARELAEVLRETLARYEAQFGPARGGAGSPGASGGPAVPAGNGRPDPASFRPF